MIVVIALWQFLAILLSGKRFSSMDLFSQDLAKYTKHIILFLTYQSDSKPFPFREWREETVEVGKV